MSATLTPSTDRVAAAEAFVRSVLVDCFKQSPSEEEIRRVAQKVLGTRVMRAAESIKQKERV